LNGKRDFIKFLILFKKKKRNETIMPLFIVNIDEYY